MQASTRCLNSSVLEGLQGIGLLIIALLALVAVFIAVSSSGTMTIEGYTLPGVDVSIVSGVLAGVFLVVGLFSLLFAWGLWRLARWAFWATVIIQVISLAKSVIAFTQPNANVGFIVGSMIVPIVILLYFLVDSNVRAASGSDDLRHSHSQRRSLRSLHIRRVSFGHSLS